MFTGITNIQLGTTKYKLKATRELKRFKLTTMTRGNELTILKIIVNNSYDERLQIH